MNIILGIIVGLLVLTFLVVSHEFGHFLMARKNGVRVLEFGVGFPPRAIAWQKGKDGKWHRLPKKSWPKPTQKPDSLILSINWLPIGGFCQMDGETCSDTEPGTFGAATFRQKSRILFGGVVTNWIIAFLIFTVLAWVGMPNFIENQFSIKSDETLSSGPITITEVVPNSPADRAGLRQNDIILSINDHPVYTSSDVTAIGSQNAGQITNYQIKRAALCLKTSVPPNCGDDIINLPVELNAADNEWGYILGVTMTSDLFATSHYTWAAPIVGIGTTVQLTGETFKGLGQMLWNLISGTVRQFNPDSTVREQGKDAISSASNSVTGPIGIISIFANTIHNFPLTLFLAGIISVSLACMNVLPIPALDGGRWLLIFIYKLKKKPLTKEIEESIVSKAFLVLLALMAIITIIDIIRIF